MIKVSNYRFNEFENFTKFRNIKYVFLYTSKWFDSMKQYTRWEWKTFIKGINYNEFYIIYNIMFDLM